MKLDKFLKDAGIMFIANIIGSGCNLLYQLLMVRTLTALDFGTLNALLSMTIVVAMPTGPFQAVVTKVIATLKANNDFAKIRAFFVLFFKKIVFLGIIILTCFYLFQDSIAVFLKIDDVNLILMFGILMMCSVILPFNLGGLQGLQKFKSLGVAMIVNGLSRLLFAILLVNLGLRVHGALGALIFASAVTLFLSFIPLKPYFCFSNKNNDRSLDERLDLAEIYKSFLPAFIILPSFGLLTNIDVILVKHFFTPLDAGVYSIAQMIGKIVLFLPGAVTIVMFPKISENHAKNKNTFLILKKSMLITGTICLLASIFFIIFPEFSLRLLTGKVETESIPLVLWFAISMTFFALNSLFQFYYLSTQNIKGIILFLLAVIFQVILIVIFHNSLIQVLHVVTFCAIFLFIANIILVKSRGKNAK